jgi:pimeloyl-ACP methyl ester carboxylesterase
VHAVDRRGRGKSHDGPGYALEREYEDIVAVVQSVAEAADAPVDLYGHSHGGIVAFGAATLASCIRKLVLYEGWPLPDPSGYALPASVEARIDALVAAGDRDGAVTAAFRAFDLMSEADLAAFRAAASWPARVAAAHTITRECRAASKARLDSNVAAQLNMPVLLITGADSRDPSRAGAEAVRALLPDARLLVLQGQEHVADVMIPQDFATHLLRFLHDSRA